MNPISDLARPGVLWAQGLRKLRGERRLIAVATAHKVGSTWVHDLLADLLRYQPWELPPDVLRRFPGQAPVDIDLGQSLEHLRPPAGGYVLKSHAYPPAPSRGSLPEWLEFVTVLRDPRDVLVSSCYYLAVLSESLGGWGPGFAALPERERILRLIDGGDFLRDRLRAWADCTYAHTVRYEALLSEPHQSMHNLLEALGECVDGERIARVCARHAFQRKAGRRSGAADPGEHRRKGIAGDWKNHFDEGVVYAFKHAGDGAWNTLLVELGYESDQDWSVR